jgi:sporulation protein YlmC with PRC-barrel domain
MLHSMNDLKGLDIRATDGEIGDIEDFYFDYEQWAVRYIIVNTGSWLSGRQVLISPFSVTQVDWDNRKLHLHLTQARVAKSPKIDTHKPVSRQMEVAHSDYYGYPYYWGSPFLWGAEERPVLASQRSATATYTAAARSTAKVAATNGHPATAGTAADLRAMSEEVHLHSTQKVASYHIAAKDGEIGHVEDFILDDDNWAIRYLVIDTRNWLPGKKVLVSPRCIAAMDWAQGKVHINLSREGVKRSPEYDSSKLISHEYETLLDQYFNQPNYWLN